MGISVTAASAAFVRLYLRGERNASPHTLRNYATDLRQFAAFLAPDRTAAEAAAADPAVADELELAQVDARQIREFLAHLYAQGCGKATVARHLAAVRSLFRYSLREGYVSEDPSRRVSTPKLSRRLPDIPATEQLNQFLDRPAGAAPRSFPEREQALLELLYGCGLRVSELTGLNCSDLDFDQRLVRVVGKGRRERVVPFGGKAEAALRAYLAARNVLAAAASPSSKSGERPARSGPKPATTRKAAALFVNRRGGRLTTRSVGRIVKASARSFGLSVDLHPHSLRHAFASHLLGEGADLRAIQEMLGHKSLATTQRYTQTNIRQIAAVYDRAHPLEGKTETGSARVEKPRRH